MRYAHTPESKTAWAWVSIGMVVPIGIATLVVVEIVAALLGYSDEDTPAWANTTADVVSYAAILAPLLIGVMLGLLGWRESHRRAALGAALLGSLLAITFFFIQG